MSDRTCLIVEDERSIRTFLRLILEREQLKVLEADNAPQALRIVQKLGGMLDCIVSDVNMPGDMNGIDLAHSIRGSFPEVPVILISGYADEECVQAAAKTFAFIRKPFLKDTILKAVKTAMDSVAKRC